MQGAEHNQPKHICWHPWHKSLTPGVLGCPRCGAVEVVGSWSHAWKHVKEVSNSRYLYSRMARSVCDKCGQRRAQPVFEVTGARVS
jgi:hypothetical protein